MSTLCPSEHERQGRGCRPPSVVRERSLSPQSRGRDDPNKYEALAENHTALLEIHGESQSGHIAQKACRVADALLAGGRCEHISQSSK